MLPSHDSSASEQQITDTVSEDSTRAATAFLVLSGALNLSAAELVGDDRTIARQKRRETSVLGCKLLSSSLGGPPVYENQRVQAPAYQQTPNKIVDWLSTRQRSAQNYKVDAVNQEQTSQWTRRALALLRRATQQRDERGRQLSLVLIVSVVRPLCEAVAASLPAGLLQTEAFADLVDATLSSDFSLQDSLEAELVSLALHLESDSNERLASVQEASAALARLIVAGPLSTHSEFLQLGATVSGGSAQIVPSPGGPYIFTGEAGVVNHLGVPLPIRGRAAFCRCGQSASKPFCDGSHAAVAFSGDKDPRRVPDARDIYVGQQATVYDNRGLCAHSGFCTDRLKTVFHVGEEPFVTPSGGRLDDIMRAVRRCPSGALSVGLRQIEDRAYVDGPRPPTIEISKDGPYRITGSISITDEKGVPVPRADGASAEHYSLCRCGSSLNKPFCSGMHWSVKFADPRPPAHWEPTLFEWAGGYPALLEMTQLFYSRHVPSDPVIGPLFARMEADHPERVAAWLSEVFGGPAFYSERYGGYTRMISQHLDKHLTQEQRSHWATLMAQSADEAGLPNDPEFRAAFMAYIEWGSRIAVENSSSGATPPANMPMPRWWWVCNAAPNTRVSAIAPVEEEPAPAEMPILTSGERPSFAKHIKTLFRPMDRNSMKFAFDLWAYEDVRTHADAILFRVKAGTMPPDKAWAPEKVALFERWTEEGRNA